MYNSGNTFTFMFLFLHKLGNQKKYNCECYSCINIKKHNYFRHKKSYEITQTENKKNKCLGGFVEPEAEKTRQTVKFYRGSLEEKMYRGIPI